MHRIVLIVLGITLIAPLAAAQSPYAGQQHRSIKSMSPQEVEALKKGAGMGYAKIAELNHYPGPRHVLDLAEPLELTPAQLAGTESLFADMKARAVALGHELIAAEAELDRAFAENDVDAESLRTALLEIGDIRARLRFVHLEAHLRQKALLTEAQVALYDELRGYDGEDTDHAAHSRHHE